MGYTNPANTAMPYLNQVPGTISPYYQPYIDAGNQSLSTLMQQFNTLLTDPGAIMQMAGSGYQQSPGYQYQYNQGMNAANSAAAAGGMLGTPYEQQDAASMANNLANQDYQQYLNQTLDLYGKGLSGEEGIDSQGYNASNELATGLATNLNNQAGLAYNGQVNQNQHNAAMMNALIGGGAAALGGTIGGVVGGPTGAVAGASIGHSLGSGGSPSGQAPMSLQGYGSPMGSGGSQQNAFHMLGQKLAQLLHMTSNNNGMNSYTMGGSY